MEIKKSLENKFNTSLANLTGSPIREFDRFASSIDGIIKLTLGEPDFDNPLIRIVCSGINSANEVCL